MLTTTKQQNMTKHKHVYTYTSDKPPVNYLNNLKYIVELH